MSENVLKYRFVFRPVSVDVREWNWFDGAFIKSKFCKLCPQRFDVSVKVDVVMLVVDQLKVVGPVQPKVVITTANEGLAKSIQELEDISLGFRRGLVASRFPSVQQYVQNESFAG